MFLQKIISFELDSQSERSHYSDNVIKNLSRLNKGVQVLVSGGIWAAYQGSSYASPLQADSGNSTEITPSTLPPHYSEDKKFPVTNMVFLIILASIVIGGALIFALIYLRQKWHYHQVNRRISEARDHIFSMGSHLLGPVFSARYVNNDTGTVSRDTATDLIESSETVLREDAVQSTPEERPEASIDSPNPPPLHQLSQSTQTIQLTIPSYLLQPVYLPHSLDPLENASPSNPTSQNVKISNPPSFRVRTPSVVCN